MGGSPSPRGFPFPGSPTVVALTRQGHPDSHTRFSVSERGSFLEVEVWSVPPSLFVGRQSRYAAEATSCTAALQHLHCPHSLLWSALLGHFCFSQYFPTLVYCNKPYAGPWIAGRLSQACIYRFSYPLFYQGEPSPGL